MKQLEEIEVGLLGIKIERKKIKNLYLKIKSSGELIVSAHPEIPLDLIIQFVKQKQTWIEQKQKKLQQLPSQLLKEDEILFLGKTYKCSRKLDVKIAIKIEGNGLAIYAPLPVSNKKLSQELQKWFFKQLRMKIKSYHNRYWPFFEEQGFKPLEIKYRQMKSTWGVCRPSQRSITYSKQLIHQPEAFIEYVVVHELCHLLQPNHSRHFYQCVALLLPQWKEYSQQKV